MKRTKRINIGSVSSGTMRPEDLIPSFLWELKQQRPLSRAHRKLIREIEARIEFETEFSDPDLGIEGMEDYDLASLFDALDYYSPEYFYFGAHPGDGADYGWWLVEDWEQQLIEDGGIKVSDISDFPSNHYGPFAVINDHGNITLYRRAKNHKLVQIWSIV